MKKSSEGIIPYSSQFIDKNDINSVKTVLNSQYLTQGPLVPKFEKSLSNYCKTKFAVVLNSATSALHVACLALGLKKGDYLWTTPISFVATANCGLYCGAKIDFIDIDINTFNLNVDLLEKKLKTTKKKPKIIIPVHLGGSPCDLKKLNRLKKKYGFKIIEDASHAIGAEYYSSKIGSCKYSDVTIFSFHPVKIITSAEGGAALCKNKKTYKLMKSYATHGIIKQPKNLKMIYNQRYLGFNYRLSEIHAALGISQLLKIDKFIKKRETIANYYINQINKRNINITYQKVLKNCKSSYHLFIILTKNKIKLLNELKKSKFYTPTHYMPIYSHFFYKKFRFDKKNFPNAEKYHKEAISIPIYFELNKKKIDHLLSLISMYA
jgi:UDP-4-amino-4,6-dideoxy-N-acetyl-beta-L-altrosamine transaminase